MLKSEFQIGNSGFNEAVTDLLKVKPPPKAQRKRNEEGQRKRLEGRPDGASNWSIQV